jgi:hypothetical protein
MMPKGALAALNERHVQRIVRRINGHFFDSEERRAQEALPINHNRAGRFPPATHIEWFVRRNALATVVSWGFG